MHRNRTLLGVEVLESRTMPNVGPVPSPPPGTGGNVSVTLDGAGNLTVTGDSGNNRLAIWTINYSTSTIRVEGVGTTINGVSGFQDFSGVTGSVVINLGSGRDFIVLGDNTTDSNAQILAISINLTVILGSGNDTVGLENLVVTGVTTIDAGAGHDLVDLDTTAPGPFPWGLSTTAFLGACTVRAGTGSDTVSIEDCGFGVLAWATVSTGSGHDSVSVKNTIFLSGRTFDGGAGSDIFYGLSPVYGNTGIGLADLSKFETVH